MDMTGQEFFQKKRRISSSSNASTPSSISSPSSFENSLKCNNEHLTSPDFDSNGKNSPGNGSGSGSNGKHKKVIPYIPSYMDLTNGPEPCVVCGDAATGYHYRCMTCEGCKGFFRRTIQKNLQYNCKWNNQCSIDKNTRNQCQQCRFRKCVAVGMATDLVLNERQRVAKRKLIEDNRQRRRKEQTPINLPPDQLKKDQMVSQDGNCFHDLMTEDDKRLISDIVAAYTQTTTKKDYVIPEHINLSVDPKLWQNLAQVMTPSIINVVEFAKKIPRFCNLDIDDQILLLKSSCMEIMCLRAAYKYDSTKSVHETKIVGNNEQQPLLDSIPVMASTEKSCGLTLLIEPIREFANGLSKLKLDYTEIALLAAVLLMQADRKGLKDQTLVENIQDMILNSYKRYIGEKRPHQPIHWAKILMKITDLRAITSKHAEKILNIKIDQSINFPQVANIFQPNSQITATPSNNIHINQLNNDFLNTFNTWNWQLHPIVTNMTKS